MLGLLPLSSASPWSIPWSRSIKSELWWCEDIGVLKKICTKFGDTPFSPRFVAVSSWKLWSETRPGATTCQAKRPMAPCSVQQKMGPSQTAWEDLYSDNPPKDGWLRDYLLTFCLFKQVNKQCEHTISCVNISSLHLFLWNISILYYNATN